MRLGVVAETEIVQMGGWPLWTVGFNIHLNDGLEWISNSLAHQDQRSANQKNTLFFPVSPLTKLVELGVT